LPVHQVRYIGGALEEQYVGVGSATDAAPLALVWSKPSTTRLAEYIERIDVTLRKAN